MIRAGRDVGNNVHGEITFFESVSSLRALYEQRTVFIQGFVSMFCVCDVTFFNSNGAKCTRQ